MTADWNQYIAISEFLLDHRSDLLVDEEMMSRCIISRAYYAAFCIIRDVAAQQRIFVISRRAEDHKKLRDALEEHGFITIASGLNRLRKLRDEADYNCDYECSIDDARYCLKLAKDVCSNSALIY